MARCDALSKVLLKTSIEWGAIQKQGVYGALSLFRRDFDRKVEGIGPH